LTHTGAATEQTKELSWLPCNPNNQQGHNMETCTTDEIIQAIAEALSECDGNFIETIARQVLTNNPSYVEDGMFTIEG